MGRLAQDQTGAPGAAADRGRRVLPAEPEAPLEAKQALYRIGREAMQNITKHSRAKKVQPCLVAQPAAIVLDIAGDGMDFHGEKDFPEHLACTAGGSGRSSWAWISTFRRPPIAAPA